MSKRRVARNPVDTLFRAAIRDDTEALNWALDNGADINAQAVLISGTALHRAGPKTARILIDRGADIHVQDHMGDTPLHLAAFKAEPEVISMLIEAGADPNARNKRGQTPLHHALHVEVVRPLVEGGARQHRDDDGRTPLDSCKYGMDEERKELMWHAEQLAVSGERREKLLELAKASRPADDLATPEQALSARQKHGREM
ncbi:ankyrin repeat domain-containing protein [Luteimonas sp. SDU101]|uniref:ankyrin repeat domain-containing protein n=1 Tax=Luteimonas sp. SDU101 TaxID=3422593 RepID=UPI003EBB8FE7